MARVPATLLAAALAAAGVLTSSPAYAAAPPTTVGGLHAKPGDAQVVLTWTNPADADFAGVTVVQKDGTTPPAAVADGTTRYTGTGTTAVVTALTNNAAYSFAVFTRNTDGDVSAPATLTATPVPALVPTLTATLSPGLVTYGQGVTISAVLKRSDDGTPIAGESVDFYRKAAGQTTFTKLGHLTTNASGAVTYKPLAPSVNMQWYLAHTANPYVGPAQSSTLTSLVRPKLGVHVSRYVAEQGVASVVSVVVSPSHAGQNVGLALKTGTEWKTVASHTLSSASATSFSIATFTLGTRYFRLTKAADSDHESTVTTAFAIRVVRRTLRPGMTGSDVTTVQKRLAALHYDTGTINGYYGFDTTHATAAFQKVNGLPITGYVDYRTYDRLWKPTSPKLRYTHSGTWVEVDLTKQVLYYVRDGAVTRILDVSSGSGQLFTVEGTTQRAVTPLGNFRILHKIDGLRISRLGSLWRPAYFAAGGFAIHGNGSVPYYPASHGCVRITISGMNRLFSMLTIGMPVHVYRS
jgi:lipoprotein-anchoring transpeptidase ErfK/SrfK